MIPSTSTNAAYMASNAGAVPVNIPRDSLLYGYSRKHNTIDLQTFMKTPGQVILLNQFLALLGKQRGAILTKDVQNESTHNRVVMSETVDPVGQLVDGERILSGLGSTGKVYKAEIGYRALAIPMTLQKDYINHFAQLKGEGVAKITPELAMVHNLLHRLYAKQWNQHILDALCGYSYYWDMTTRTHIAQPPSHLIKIDMGSINTYMFGDIRQILTTGLGFKTKKVVAQAAAGATGAETFYNQYDDVNKVRTALKPVSFKGKTYADELGGNYHVFADVETIQKIKKGTDFQNLVKHADTRGDANRAFVSGLGTIEGLTFHELPSALSKINREGHTWDATDGETESVGLRAQDDRGYWTGQSQFDHSKVKVRRGFILGESALFMLTNSGAQEILSDVNEMQHLAEIALNKFQNIKKVSYTEETNDGKQRQLNFQNTDIGVILVDFVG